MSYGMQKNDHNTGTQLNLSNYNSLHPLIYLICLSKQKSDKRFQTAEFQIQTFSKHNSEFHS